jgi:hypothetical protein
MWGGPWPVAFSHKAEKQVRECFMVASHQPSFLSCQAQEKLQDVLSRLRWSLCAVLWISVPQSPGVKGLVPSPWYYWEVTDPLRVRLSGRKLGWSLEMWPWRNIGTMGSCLSLYFLAAMRWTGSLCHTLLPCFVFPCHRSIRNKIKWPWTETFETMSPNKPFLLINYFLLFFETGSQAASTSWVLGLQV